MMDGFDEMITVKEEYTDQNGRQFGKSDINRGGYHASTATALTSAWLNSEHYKDSPGEKKSFMKHQQESGQIVSIMQHLTLSEWHRPVIYKIHRYIF